jgi:transcription initiation factor IIF auxiliary subunit
MRGVDMALRFEREVVKDEQGRVQFKVFQSGGREHFHLKIWLDGPDDELDQVEKVEYLLHPTFRFRKKSSSNRMEKFAISIWTWGMFNIEATIHYNNGTTEKREYYLSYELPVDTGQNYVLV